MSHPILREQAYTHKDKLYCFIYFADQQYLEIVGPMPPPPFVGAVGKLNYFVSGQDFEKSCDLAIKWLNENVS